MSDWVAETVRALAATGVDTVAYLPDTGLDPLIERLEADDEFETILVTREEAAVGALVGAWLGGSAGALLCQSSGLANSLNAVASLSLPARVPFVGIVLRRGNLGEFNIAQVPGGYGLDRVLDDLGVRNAVVDEADRVGETIQLASETAFSTQSPYVVLIEQTIPGRKAETEVQQ